MTVHGALEEWTLRLKPFRKMIYMKLVQDRILNSADALHAITSSEAARIAELGYKTPVFTAPNGVSVDLLDDFCCTDTSGFLARHPELMGKRIILFMGRLHPIKGTEILASSFATIAEDFRDTMLLFAGPDEDGTRARIESTLRRHGVLDRAVFTGILTDDDWYAAFRCADLFVLPSYSEGFSIAILESLAAGLPVVISDQCNFPEVAENEAGFVVQLDEGQVADAMTRLLLDGSLRAHMGQNGRRLIEERYNWTSISESVVDVYRTIIRDRKSKRPETRVL